MVFIVPNTFPVAFDRIIDIIILLNYTIRRAIADIPGD